MGGRANEPLPAKELSCSLSVAQPLAGARNVTLTFTLRNGSDRPVAVLGWNTPFDGWFGEYLDVMRDGTRVPYEGPIAKRGAPAADDYVTIGARGQRSASLDMAAAYAVSQAGRYRVTFRGRLHDVRVDGTSRAPGMNPASITCGMAEFSVG